MPWESTPSVRPPGYFTSCWATLSSLIRQTVLSRRRNITFSKITPSNQLSLFLKFLFHLMGKVGGKCKQGKFIFYNSIIQDLILLHNLSGWFLTVGRLSGMIEYVMDPTVRLEFLQTREEHGKSMIEGVVTGQHGQNSELCHHLRLSVRCLEGGFLQCHLRVWSESSEPRDHPGGSGPRRL